MHIYTCLSTGIVWTFNVIHGFVNVELKLRASETAESRSHHLEWDQSHAGATLLGWEGWHEISSSPTLSSSVHLKDCSQYCVTWLYLCRNHIMEIEVHRKWKRRLSPKSNQLPQNPSGLSAVEFHVS